eukprot:gene2302-2475_t
MLKRSIKLVGRHVRRTRFIHTTKEFNLTKKQENILTKEKETFYHLYKTIKEMNGDEEDLKYLKDTIEQLDELFLITIVGEFNSGKSSFINSILGDKYMKEGVIPTTKTIHIIKYGDELKEEYDINKNQNLMELPLNWLKGIKIVDTPGTNAILREHEEITKKYIPRSDFILFITSCERPFSESEKEFMKNIKEWGKKIIIVLNKVDLFKSKEELNQVESFIKEGIKNLIGIETKLYSISSLESLNFKLNLDESKISKEFKNLENYLFNNLNSEERIKLKLKSQIGVGEKILIKNLNELNLKLNILKKDEGTIKKVENQLNYFLNDMESDFKLFEDSIEKIFLEFNERTNIFFDEVLTLKNFFNLSNKKKIEEKFKNEVVSDFIPSIDKFVSNLIDWIIDRKYRQHKSIQDFILKRSNISEDNLIGSLKNEFKFNRNELLLNIGNSSNEILKLRNEKNEIDNINNEIKSSIYNTISIELSAIGVGTASYLLLPSLTFEITGILTASLIGVLGLYTIPMKNKKLKLEFKKNINFLKEKLKKEIKMQFNFDLNNSIQGINNSISPYSNFVKSELKSLKKQKEDLDILNDSFNKIKFEIKNLNQFEENEKIISSDIKVTVHDEEMKETEKEQTAKESTTEEITEEIKEENK